jgi:hypothetical protein
MRAILNILGVVVLLLLLLLRRSFDTAFAQLPRIDREHARRLRFLLGPAVLTMATFLALALWALIDAGYWAVAILVLAHVVLLLLPARRPPNGEPEE